MSNNYETPAGRSEKLIPLVRKTFGDKMVIYADSNGSYTADEAIRIGKIMEEYKLDFYEEPVPFDWYEETKEVCRCFDNTGCRRGTGTESSYVPLADSK